jgi:hypothetical protein
MPAVRVERVRLARLERVEADEQPRRLEERALPHRVGAPVGMVCQVDDGWMFHRFPSFCRCGDLCRAALAISPRVSPQNAGYTV